MKLLSPPKTYVELIPKLSRSTFLSTLVFFVVLRSFDFIPYITIESNLIPPLKNYKDIIEWALSFGILPFAAALTAWVLSAVFEMHNKIAKVLGIRYLWDKYFIVRHLAQKIASNMVLNKRNVKKVMNELFYPEVKNIDSHYIHLFWRYAFFFWVIFEHTVIVFITAIVLSIYNYSFNIIWLWLWFLFLLTITTIQLVFVTGQKSKDEAEQIPIEKLREYFETQMI